MAVSVNEGSPLHLRLTLSRLQEVRHGVDRQRITVDAKAADEGRGRQGDVGVAAECFALVRIRNVQFDDRLLDHVERIEDRDRRMRKSRRIDDDAGGAVDGAVDPLDELRFAVRLMEGDHEPARLGPSPAHFLDLGQRRRAVDVRFAPAEQIEVGTVQNKDGFAHGGLSSALSEASAQVMSVCAKSLPLNNKARSRERASAYAAQSMKFNCAGCPRPLP